MHKLCLILLSLVMVQVAAGQDKSSPFERLQSLIQKTNVEAQGPKGTIDIPRVLINDKLRDPQSEVEDAIVYLSEYVEQENVPYIRFFSTYAVPPSERDDLILTLSFAIHSLVGISNDVNYGNAGGYYPLAKMKDGKLVSYRKVPFSDTLWWIDIREYNWTPQAWETISVGDGYFSEPIVDHETSGVLRLLSGNAVLRADWFIHHAMSTTAQLDLGKENDFYTTLLYALAEKPDNIEEWRNAWGLNINKSRLIGNEFGTLVTKSNAVARHNRMLFGYRTELGYMYETYDVKSQKGKRDYLEALFLNKNPGQPPEVSDAGEAFASNMLGLQVYALRNESGNLVQFGDPSVVRHYNDVLGDVRVRVGHSCIDCHASGPIPSENTLQEIVNADTSLKAYNKKDALRLNRSLLSKKFTDSVKDNQQLFARAVEKVNGLTPEENGELYLKAVLRYRQPVSVSKAAYECGLTETDFLNLLKQNPRYGARLKLLSQTGEPIPRDIWESASVDGIPGAFQQAMILLKGLTSVTKNDNSLYNQVTNIDEPDKVVLEIQTPQKLDIDYLLGRDVIFVEDIVAEPQSAQQNTIEFDRMPHDLNTKLEKYRVVRAGSGIFVIEGTNKVVLVGKTNGNEVVFASAKTFYRPDLGPRGGNHRFTYDTNGKRVGYIRTDFLVRSN